MAFMHYYTSQWTASFVPYLLILPSDEKRRQKLIELDRSLNAAALRMSLLEASNAGKRAPVSVSLSSPKWTAPLTKGSCDYMHETQKRHRISLWDNGLIRSHHTPYLTLISSISLVEIPRTSKLMVPYFLRSPCYTGLSLTISLFFLPSLPPTYDYFKLLSKVHPPLSVNSILLVNLQETTWKLLSQVGFYSHQLFQAPASREHFCHS